MQVLSTELEVKHVQLGGTRLSMSAVALVYAYHVGSS